MEVAVSWRVPAEISVEARLARALQATYPPGLLGSVRRKTIRTVFGLLHQRLAMPAPGVMRIADGSTVNIDCANTGFLDYAARNRREGAYEPEVSATLAAFADRLRMVYDVGANWGYYPLLLGTDPRFRGSLHAFEVNSSTTADLRRVIAGAGFASRVIVHGFGLSDRNGGARLSREKHSYLSRIVDSAYSGRTDLVCVRRLDDLRLPPPDLIKIDVEGHELAVLTGAAEVLARHQPLVIIESWYQPASVEAMLKPLRLLVAFGYRLHRLDWRPLPGAMAEQAVKRGTLVLTPLAVSDRPAIPQSLNLLAVPPWQEPCFADTAGLRH
jgi:FkbM family methyltransferase